MQYNAKEMAMTHYEIIKQWRIKLHAKRCKDNDQSKERYIRDANVLNRAMSLFKVQGRKAKWA